ncbi:hypothetical protein VPH35_058532 [Triticum aestivum]
MEPTETSFLVAADTPPPKTVQLGQGEGSARPGCGWAFWAILSLVTGNLARGLYRARHSSAHDLARHELLRRDDDPAAAPEQRRARLRVWAASLAVGGMIVLQLAGDTPDLAPKFALTALGCLAMALAWCCIYAGHRARADAGSWPEKDLHEVSPEHRV